RVRVNAAAMGRVEQDRSAPFGRLEHVEGGSPLVFDVAHARGWPCGVVVCSWRGAPASPFLPSLSPETRYCPWVGRLMAGCRAGFTRCLRGIGFIGLR